MSTSRNWDASLEDDMAKTVGQAFGMEQPKVVSMSKRTSELVIPKTSAIDSSQEIGIEVEVENFQSNNYEQDYCWVNHNDGSLRNNGIEFVTRVVKASDSPYLLVDLMDKFLHKDCCFSPRTSIHVHFNMIPYTVDQVKNIVLLYSCFEPLFFRFTGRGRQKNIYCVPLIDTTLIQHFERSGLREVAARWTKYSSLNLLPLTTQGTIEARHMHGTFDVNKISIWIRLWCKLIEYCVKNEVTAVRKLIAGMSNTTDYGTLLRDIFGDDVQYMKYREFPDIERSVSTVKTAFVNPNTPGVLIGERDLEKAAYFLFKAK